MRKSSASYLASNGVKGGFVPVPNQGLQCHSADELVVTVYLVVLEVYG